MVVAHFFCVVPILGCSAKEHLCCTTLSEIVLSTDMNNFKGVGGGEGAEGGRKYCCWKLFILLSKLKTCTEKSHYIFNNLQKYPGRLIICVGQIPICFISKATPANKRWISTAESLCNIAAQFNLK